MLNEFSLGHQISLTLRVPRESVMSAAASAIRETRRDGFAVSTAEARRLMRVARTAPEFLLGGWFLEGRCGCLVGNYLGRDIDLHEDGRALVRVGANFDSALQARLSDSQRRRYDRDHHPALVKVTG